MSENNSQTSKQVLCWATNPLTIKYKSVKTIEKVKRNNKSAAGEAFDRQQIHKDVQHKPHAINLQTEANTSASKERRSHLSYDC